MDTFKKMVLVAAVSSVMSHGVCMQDHGPPAENEEARLLQDESLPSLETSTQYMRSFILGPLSGFPLQALRRTMNPLIIENGIFGTIGGFQKKEVAGKGLRLVAPRDEFERADRLNHFRGIWSRWAGQQDEEAEGDAEHAHVGVLEIDTLEKLTYEIHEGSQFELDWAYQRQGKLARITAQLKSELRDLQTFLKAMNKIRREAVNASQLLTYVPENCYDIACSGQDLCRELNVASLEAFRQCKDFLIDNYDVTDKQAKELLNPGEWQKAKEDCIECKDQCVGCYDWFAGLFPSYGAQQGGA